MREVAIRDDVIRLGQLLKLADVVDTGADVKSVLAAGGVSVNAQAATPRGRQLTRGDLSPAVPGAGAGPVDAMALRRPSRDAGAWRPCRRRPP